MLTFKVWLFLAKEKTNKSHLKDLQGRLDPLNGRVTSSIDILGLQKSLLSLKEIE